MRRWAGFLGVLACLVAAILWFAGDRGRPSAGRKGAPETHGESASRLASKSETTREGRERIDSEAKSVLVETPANSGASLTLLVLRALDDTPFPGLDVELGTRESQRSGTTDARGELRLDLAGTGLSFGDSVPLEIAYSRDVEFYHSTRDERVLFRGRVLLDERMTVRVEDCVEFTGLVVDKLGIPLPLESVQAFEPGSGARYTSVFLARDAESGSDGAFSMTVCGRRPVPEVELEIHYEGGALRRTVPWNELVAPEGARILVEFGDFLATVRDERGVPLAGATVRAIPSSGAAGYPEEVETDAAGEARFRFASRDAYVSAGLAGHSPDALWFVRPPGSTQAVASLTLRTLGAQEAITGFVRHADGTPVANALVTAFPTVELPNQDLGGAAMVQVRSGADGRFRLPWAEEKAAELVAYGRGDGLSRMRVVEPGEREVELVIDELGTLEIHLAPVELAPEFTSGLVEHVLVARAGGTVDIDHAFDVPFDLEELAVGDYDVWVLHHGWSAWAEGFAHVEGGTTTSVTLPARPLRKARGTLRRADGSLAGGVRLRPLVPGWPDALADIWTATVAPDGRFELVLGASASARVLPVETDRTHEPLPIAAGDGQDLVLR